MKIEDVAQQNSYIFYKDLEKGETFFPYTHRNERTLLMKCSERRVVNLKSGDVFYYEDLVKVIKVNAKVVVL